MHPKDILHDAHQNLLIALEGISEEDAESSLFVVGQWNVRDVVAHLATYERILEEILGSQLGPTDTTHLNQYVSMPRQEFDQFYYEEKKFSNYPEVLAELNSSHQHIMAVFYLITEEILRAKVPLKWHDGKQHSLKDFIAETARYKREHADKITLFKKHLLDLKNQPSKQS